MKHLFTFLLLTCLIAHASFSQSNDTIQVVKNGMKVTYQQGDKTLTPAEFKATLQTNSEAYAVYKKGQDMMVPAMILAIGGGALIGNYLGKSITGQDPAPAQIIAGVTLAGVGIGIGASVDKKTKKAIQIYNNAAKQTSSNTSFKYNFNLTPSGLSFKMTF